MPVGGRKTFSTMRGTALIYAMFSILGIAGVIGFIAEKKTLIALLAALIAVLFAINALRLARGGIFSDGEHLVATHDLGTSKTRWLEIDRFEYRGTKGLGLWKRDGKWTLLRYMAPSSGSMSRVMDELNRELQCRRDLDR